MPRKKSKSIRAKQLLAAMSEVYLEIRLAQLNLCA